jgi:hypothetical protein
MLLLTGEVLLHALWKLRVDLFLLLLHYVLGCQLMMVSL